jgi:hypothetical protein
MRIEIPHLKRNKKPEEYKNPFVKERMGIWTRGLIAIGLLVPEFVFAYTTLNGNPDVTPLALLLLIPTVGAEIELATTP